MSDLLDSLSNTDGTGMAIAVHSVNPAIMSCAIAHSNGDSVTTETAIAITAKWHDGGQGYPHSRMALR